MEPRQSLGCPSACAEPAHSLAGQSIVGNFHKIILSTKLNRYPISLFKTLLGKYYIDWVKSIEWGKTHEVNAINEFEKLYNCHVTKNWDLVT
jgi:hypothetical protein